MNFKLAAFFLSLLLGCFYSVSAKTFNYHNFTFPLSENLLQTPLKGGIYEIIPAESQINYNNWKAEFLSTDYGKNLWEKYSKNKNFTLTIKIAGKGNKGGQTADYQWDENGLLIGATIYLGGRINKGIPDAIYYPVMNSINEFNDRKEISGTTLAATKMAHEFGHINRTIETNQEKFKTQNKLMPIYNSIFLKNGYNTSDQKLIDLANQMGGTPIQIWEDREYWGEASAMSFLLEKTKNKYFYCSLINKINENVSNYATDYKERFNKISQTNAAFICEN